MRIEVSTTIDRPLDVVWEFCVVDHERNHPRWDPSVELESTTEGPVRVGTVFRRRTHRFGNLTEGTMEVTGLEPKRSMEVRTQDGPTRIDGWMHFEAIDDDTTVLTRGGDFPDIDDARATSIEAMMAEAGAAVKTLIESDT